MRTFSPFLRASTASASEGSSFFGRLSGSNARRSLGDDHNLTLALRSLLADSLLNNEPTLDGVREAIAIREDINKRSRRLLGGAHPATQIRQRALDFARSALALVLSEG